MVGSGEAANKEAPEVAAKPRSVQIMTIISWCTYLGVPLVIDDNPSINSECFLYLLRLRHQVQGAEPR